MNINRVHCLFEQSGTFKKVFLDNNIQAFDYDIQDEFNQTDFQVDLFEEISRINFSSVFDDIKLDDLAFAFFPCTYFEVQSCMVSRCDTQNMIDWIPERKISACMENNRLRFTYFEYLNQLVDYFLRSGKRLILENPYYKYSFLKNFWCFKPDIIHEDRTKFGDYFKKPTGYWFFNCEPESSLFFKEYQLSLLDNSYTVHTVNGKDLGVKNRRAARSLISTGYAEYFIKQYLLS